MSHALRIFLNLGERYDVIGLGGGGFQIMTGEGFLPKMTSFFTTIFGLIFASLLVNLEKKVN